MTDSNGDMKSVPWKWVAATLSFIVIALVGAWGNDVTRRTAISEAKIASQHAEITMLKSRLDSIFVRIDRIDDKLEGVVIRPRYPR